MKFWMTVATGLFLVIGLSGCNDKLKQDFAKCQADSAKATAELNAAKSELDTTKKAMADMQVKFTDLTKERDALLTRITEFETAANIAAEEAAAKAAGGTKKAAKKEAAPAPKTSTGAAVPKVEQKFKGRFSK